MARRLIVPEGHSVQTSRVKALASSIQRYGLLQPVVVRSVSEEESAEIGCSFSDVVLVAGFHRAAAWAQLYGSLDDLPRTSYDQDEARNDPSYGEASLEENLVRRHLTQAEIDRLTAEQLSLAETRRGRPRTAAAPGSRKERKRSNGGPPKSGHSVPISAVDEPATADDIAEAHGVTKRSVRRRAQRARGEKPKPKAQSGLEPQTILLELADLVKLYKDMARLRSYLSPEARRRIAAIMVEGL